MKLIPTRDIRLTVRTQDFHSCNSSSILLYPTHITSLGKLLVLGDKRWWFNGRMLVSKTKDISSILLTRAICLFISERRRFA